MRCVEGFVKVEKIDGSPVRPFPCYIFVLALMKIYRLNISALDFAPIQDRRTSGNGSRTLGQSKIKKSRVSMHGVRRGGIGGRRSFQVVE